MMNRLLVVQPGRPHLLPSLIVPEDLSVLVAAGYRKKVFELFLAAFTEDIAERARLEPGTVCGFVDMMTAHRALEVAGSTLKDLLKRPNLLSVLPHLAPLPALADPVLDVDYLVHMGSLSGTGSGERRRRRPSTQPADLFG